MIMPVAEQLASLGLGHLMGNMSQLLRKILNDLGFITVTRLCKGSGNNGKGGKVLLKIDYSDRSGN